MRSAIITLKDTNPHDLFEILSGRVPTGQATTSQTEPNIVSTGWSLTLWAGTANVGTIIYGDGTIATGDPGLLKGQSVELPGKTSLAGLFLLATSANDTVKVIWGEGVG